MAAFVQQQVNNTVASVSLAKAFNSFVTAGNLIAVLIVTDSTSPTVVVTDSLGSTYSQAGSYRSLSGAGRASWWYAVAASSGSCTVSATISAIGPWWLYLSEWSGTSAVIDGTNGSTGSNPSPTTGSIPVAGTDDLVLAAFATQGGYVAQFPASPFSPVYFGASSGTALLTDFQVAYTTGAAAAKTCTFDQIISDEWVSLGASFLAAPASPPPPPPVPFYAPPDYSGFANIPGTPQWFMQNRQGYPHTSPASPPSPTSPIPLPPPSVPGTPSVPPVPPLPPEPTVSDLTSLLVQTDPDADPRTRDHLDHVSEILNSFFRTGQVVRADGQYVIIAPTEDGLTGEFGDP